MKLSVHKLLKNLALLLVLIALVGGFYAMLKQMREDSSSHAVPNSNGGVPPTSSPSPEVEKGSQATFGSSTAIPRSGSPSEPLEKQWDLFRSRFGTHLRARFVAGYLASIAGEAGTGARDREGFSVADPRAALLRAREILKELSELLGISSDAPLDEGLAKTSAVSAQVFFRQTFQGVPVAPKGSITVSLGAGGELIGLDSDYLVPISAGNTRTILVDQARLLADQAASTIEGTPSRVEATEGGNAVFWMTASGQGRHAWEFFSRGHQIIIDAQSGKELFKRDRRMQ